MNKARVASRPIAVASLILMVTLAVHAEDHAAATDVHDPWESYNRAMFGFNLKLDHAILRPVAHAYRDGVPSPMRVGIGNFLDNLDNPLNLVNNLLQGKPLRASSDLARLVVNLTVGIGGFFDPASKMGLTQSDEDFGQTLGKWGAGPGPYLVLPFLPPGGLRDQIGKLPDQRLDPFSYAESDTVEYGGKLLDLVEQRYRVVALDEAVDQAYDPYAFVRDAMAQRRAYKVRDGVAEPVDYDELYEDVPEEGPADPPPAAAPPPPPPW